MSVTSLELSPPSLPPQASVSPPWDPKGGDQHSLLVEGAEGPNSEDWTEILTLYESIFSVFQPIHISVVF